MCARGARRLGTDMEKAGAKLGDVLLPETTKIPPRELQPSPLASKCSGGGEHGCALRGTVSPGHCSQNWFVPQLRGGDRTAENSPPWALNLEAICKSTPHFGGPSADPASQQS